MPTIILLVNGVARAAFADVRGLPDASPASPDDPSEAGMAQSVTLRTQDTSALHALRSWAEEAAQGSRSDDVVLVVSAGDGKPEARYRLLGVWLSKLELETVAGGVGGQVLSATLSLAEIVRDGA